MYVYISLFDSILEVLYNSAKSTQTHEKKSPFMRGKGENKDNNTSNSMDHLAPLLALKGEEKQNRTGREIKVISDSVKARSMSKKYEKQSACAALHLAPANH